MKITKSQLKQIIREEIESSLGNKRTLKEMDYDIDSFARMAGLNPSRNNNKKSPFRRFLELALDSMFENGVQDKQAQTMLQLDNEGKMDYDEIFDVWDNVGLELFTQSDIENIAQQAHLPQQDIDYIMDLKQVRDLEQG